MRRKRTVTVKDLRKAMSSDEDMESFMFRVNGYKTNYVLKDLAIALRHFNTAEDNKLIDALCKYRLP